jgi:hypothetical protein
MIAEGRILRRVCFAIIFVCSQFVEACFGPFSAQLAKVGPYRALEKEAQDLIGALHEKLERRRRDLQTGLGVGVRSKIKLTTLELKVKLMCTYVIFPALYCIKVRTYHQKYQHLCKQCRQ